MASQVGGLIHDQHSNVHHSGASAGVKNPVAKAPRKGGHVGRKPLGDLSNSVKPTPTQSLKKLNSNSLSEKVIGASKSKSTTDGSKKKSLSKAPEKLPTSGRKALADISNSGKPHLHEASKKNLNEKLTVVAEEDLSDFDGEGEWFLHNHEECIKLQNKAMDIDEILKMVGLDEGFLKHSSEPPQLSESMPESPRYMELEEVSEEELEKPDSPSPCRSPTPPDRHMWWRDIEDANFKLIESP